MSESEQPAERMRGVAENKNCRKVGMQRTSRGLAEGSATATAAERMCGAISDATPSRGTWEPRDVLAISAPKAHPNCHLISDCHRQ